MFTIFVQIIYFVSIIAELPFNPLGTSLENDDEPIDTSEPVSMAKIYAKREEALQKCKFRIGLLSSTLLENPEQKVGSLRRTLLP